MSVKVGNLTFVSVRYRVLPIEGRKQSRETKDAPRSKRSDPDMYDGRE